MNVRIFYHSTTGNTKKVAEAMAGQLGVKAEDIATYNFSVAADVLFIGTAVYATYDHGINPAVRAFIAKLEPSKVRKAVLFATGFAPKAIDTMRELLKDRKITVAGESFFCKGKLFVIFNFGHPNKTDLEKAREFAGKAVPR